MSYGGSTPGIYNVLDYALRCDGKVIYDAVLSAGHDISSATYTFTSKDVGKVVAVDGGVVNGTFVGTIISVAAGKATLNANQNNSLSGMMFFGTDDTAALQALINKVGTDGGGTIQFVDRTITMIAGAQQTGSSPAAYSGQILIPAYDGRFGQGHGPATIRFAGGTPSNTVFYGPQTAMNVLPEQTAPIIFATDNTAGGNALDVIPVSTPLGNFSMWTVRFDNLVIRQQRNTLAGCLRLKYAWNALITGCSLGIAINASTLSTNQPAGSAVAVVMPDSNNDTVLVVRDSQIYGYPTGIVHTEHTVLDNVSIYCCIVAVAPYGGLGHLVEYRKLLLQCNTTHIKPTGRIFLTATLSLESETGGTYAGRWWINVYDFDDTNGYLVGHLAYHRTDQNVISNPASNVVYNGAANLKKINLGTATGAFTPNVPATATPSLVQNGGVAVHRDVAVTVTGGTVTAIAVDGTATGLTAGTVFVPSCKTFTLTYTVAPTVTAVAL